MTALAAIDRLRHAPRRATKAIVAKAGLDPARSRPPGMEGGVGGPYIPAEIDPSARVRPGAGARRRATSRRLTV